LHNQKDRALDLSGPREIACRRRRSVDWFRAALWTARRLSLRCRFGKFHHVCGRTLVLGCNNRIDQNVQSRTSRAARLVIAAQIVAGSFKMEVDGGKVASHGFSLCPPSDKDGHLDLPKGKYPQADLNQIWPVNHIQHLEPTLLRGHVLSSASGNRPAPETGAGFLLEWCASV
jgi:hypothetical protein